MLTHLRINIIVGGDKLIILDLKTSKPIYEQIVEQMKLHVMQKNLKPGDAIPSVRKLALDLKITPGTVSKAYQELERDGIIETIRGKGTFIASEIVVKEDESKLAKIKKDLNSVVLELKVMGYSEAEIEQLVKAAFNQMR